MAERARFDAQFRRRARQGKCFQQPYFGCREFPAFFDYLDPAPPPTASTIADQDLGLMLYDFFDLSADHIDDGVAPFITLFHPRMADGVIEVPPYASDAVRKPGRPTC